MDSRAVSGQPAEPHTHRVPYCCFLITPDSPQPNSLSMLTAYKVNPSILFIKNEDLFFIYFVSSSTLDGMKDPKKQRSWALP